MTPATILVNPRVEANRLHALPGCYKIKLRSSGYRPVYQVFDVEVMVFVVAVDKRERALLSHKSG
jgi:mRNA interferase RelE/StbE